MKSAPLLTRARVFINLASILYNSLVSELYICILRVTVWPCELELRKVRYGHSGKWYSAQPDDVEEIIRWKLQQNLRIFT
jgi:hypothetical protein